MEIHHGWDIEYIRIYSIRSPDSKKVAQLNILYLGAILVALTLIHLAYFCYSIARAFTPVPTAQSVLLCNNNRMLRGPSVLLAIFSGDLHWAGGGGGA